MKILTPLKVLLNKLVLRVLVLKKVSLFKNFKPKTFIFKYFPKNTFTPPFYHILTPNTTYVKQVHFTWFSWGSQRVPKIELFNIQKGFYENFLTKKGKQIFFTGCPNNAALGKLNRGKKCS